MNPKEAEAYEMQLNKSQLQTQQAMMGAQQNALARQQQNIVQEEQNKSMTKEQLDLEDDMRRINYLLWGYSSYIDEAGIERWYKPDNDELIVLSEYGIQMVRDAIAWYVNKNTLLSNYDDNQINDKMLDFTNDLNDDLYFVYEKAFKYPTMEECKQEIKKRIQKKADVRLFAKELLGQEADEVKIKAEILKEMEDRIEEEFEVVKQQKMKQKLKRFAMIIRKVQDLVHSTYQRSWKGMERGSLRKHFHITENRGGPQIEKEKSSFFSMKKK